jgi:hypothetical protein
MKNDFGFWLVAIVYSLLFWGLIMASGLRALVDR